VNALEAMSSEMKGLRSLLSDMKGTICQPLATGNGFLDACISALPGWRRALPSYPVVSWSSFVEYIRATVNSLASDEHIRELVCSLQLVGEVVYIETEDDDVDDIIVLSPHWLGSDVIGRLLCRETTAHCRPTGCFTVDDFQPLLPDTTSDDILVLLSALEFSTRCDLGDETPEHEIEHEIPCLNFVETLAGLWDRDDERIAGGAVYGGVRFETGRLDLDHFINIFPRIQCRLRRLFLCMLRSDPDCDLYQWFHGSKFCSGLGAEALITLEKDEQAIEVKCRGLATNETSAMELFRFREELTRVIIGAVRDCLPGISIDLSYLSATDLAVHDSAPYAYASGDVLLALSEGRTTVGRTIESQGVEEEPLSSLLSFGCDAILSTVPLGLAMHVSQIPLDTRRRLCILLDPPDPFGRDWCMLAVTLGLSSKLPSVEGGLDALASPTDRVLMLWSEDHTASISALLAALTTLGRMDAVGTIHSTIPVFDYMALANESAATAQ
jgi:death-associated protein kinase